MVNVEITRRETKVFADRMVLLEILGGAALIAEVLSHISRATNRTIGLRMLRVRSEPYAEDPAFL